jgi:arylsulfatase A-like enzyme
VQGKSLKELPTNPQARLDLDQTVYVQISASMVGRAIRTPEWTFCSYDPDLRPDHDPMGESYLDFCMYQVGADPYQKTNLVGRPEYEQQAKLLRAELLRRILANGEPRPEMKPQHYYV